MTVMDSLADRHLIEGIDNNSLADHEPTPYDRQPHGPRASNTASRDFHRSGSLARLARQSMPQPRGIIERSDAPPRPLTMALPITRSSPRSTSSRRQPGLGGASGIRISQEGCCQLRNAILLHQCAQALELRGKQHFDALKVRCEMLIALGGASQIMASCTPDGSRTKSASPARTMENTAGGTSSQSRCSCR